MAGCYNQPFAFVFIADVVLLDVKRYFCLYCKPYDKETL